MSVRPQLTVVPAGPTPLEHLSIAGADDDGQGSSRYTVWIWIAVLTLLLHLTVSLLRFQADSVPRAPVQVHTVDPAQVEALRKKWRNERDKPMVLNRDKSIPKEAEAPEDARYLSDRNRRVE